MDLEKMVLNHFIPRAELDNQEPVIKDPDDWFTEEEYRQLSYDELIEHNMKKDRRIRNYKKKIAKLTESKAQSQPKT